MDENLSFRFFETGDLLLYMDVLRVVAGKYHETKPLIECIWFDADHELHRKYLPVDGLVHLKIEFTK